MAQHALIFDCDGTLTHSMPARYQCWKKVLARHGLRFDERRFYELAGVPARTIIGMLSQEQKVPVDVDRLSKEKQRSFLEMLEHIQPIVSTISIVRKHWGRSPMAVASGGRRESVVAQLRHLKLHSAFATVVTAEDVQRPKPDPEVFLTAALRLGVPPRRCTVYEDADLGIEAARRCGMQWVDVRQ